MATVVNARDVQLQSAPTRVANISVAPNLILDQSQVDGLGIVIQGVDGARYVKLTATTQVFQTALGGTVSPASTTLTAQLNNLSGTPTLSVISGTISPAPVLSNGSVTIAHADMTTSSAVIRASVTQDGNTYTDDITLVKVVEGDTSLAGFLTNEVHTIPADSLGHPLSYYGATGAFKVYRGTDDITHLCTFSVLSNPQGLTHSAPIIGATNGQFTVSGGIDTNESEASITFRATFGAQTLDKVLLLVKQINGSTRARAARTFYVALSGETATYSDSLATTTAINFGGGAVFQDVVTQYNDGISPSFVESKSWNGSSWIAINAVVDGNLLVKGTVGADAVRANTITGTHINATNLAAIKASLGTVTIDASGYLRTNGATAYGTGSGIWLGDDAGVYKLRVGNPSGNRITWDGTNLSIVGGGTFTGALSAATGTFNGAVNGGSFTGYSWPSSGGTGFHISASGLMLGNANDGRYFQVQAGGNIYTPRFSVIDGTMRVGGSDKFVVTPDGNVSVDTIDIKRRTVLEQGNISITHQVDGGYYVDDGYGGVQWTYYPVGHVFVITLPGFYLTNVYDTASLSQQLNQPYFVQCWPTAAPLRNWSGAGGSTFNFQYVAKVAPLRSFSNAGMYQNDGRLAFQVHAVVRIESGSFTRLNLPDIDWTIYRV